MTARSAGKSKSTPSKIIPPPEATERSTTDARRQSHSTARSHAPGQYPRGGMVELRSKSHDAAYEHDGWRYTRRRVSSPRRLGWNDPAVARCPAAGARTSAARAHSAPDLRGKHRVRRHSLSPLRHRSHARRSTRAERLRVDAARATSAEEVPVGSCGSSESLVTAP